MTKPSKPDLRVNIGPVALKNPVITASGTFGYGEEFASLVDLNSIGAIIVKGLSLKPKAGNAPPRIVETSCGMLNAIGLANVGVENFLKEKLPKLEGLECKVIANIYGERLSDYGELASAFKGVKGVSALEINISCPNVDKGGMAFGTDPTVSSEVTELVLKKSHKPVIVKLTPNVTDIQPIAKAVESAGAHGISLINTLAGMAIDINSRRPKLANIMGGLSGPAIKPVALKMVYQAVNAVKIPVIGIGGIINESDALEFLIAGASAVQIGTANFVNPHVAEDVIDGIEKYCRDRDIGDIHGVIGSLEV